MPVCVVSRPNQNHTLRSAAPRLDKFVPVFLSKSKAVHMLRALRDQTLYRHILLILLGEAE